MSKLYVNFMSIDSTGANGLQTFKFRYFKLLDSSELLLLSEYKIQIWNFIESLGIV